MNYKVREMKIIGHPQVCTVCRMAMHTVHFIARTFTALGKMHVRLVYIGFNSNLSIHYIWYLDGDVQN